MGEPDKTKCSTPLIEILQYYVGMLDNIGHDSMRGWHPQPLKMQIMINY